MMRLIAAGIVILAVLRQLAPAAGSIGGVVMKAGTAIEQPLSNARLELTSEKGPAMVVRTNATGSFLFSNLPPGKYGLSVTCDGYIRQNLPKKIVIRPGQPTDAIRFELETAPTAAGTALDSFGEPISNIIVEALRRSYDVRGKATMTRVASAVTDDRGQYRIFWLDPGEYFFFVSSAPSDAGEAGPQLAFTPVYFPGVNTPEDAKPLRLEIGREIRVDFRLLRRVALWNVVGHAMNAITGRSVDASITLTPPGGDPGLLQYRAASSATGPFSGEFAANNIAPGEYIVTAKSASGDQELMAVQRVVLRPIPYAPFVLPPNQNLNLNLSPPLSINGRVFVESPQPVDLRGTNAMLTAIDAALPSPRSVPARSDGQFTLAGVVPGTYLLDLSNLPGDFYLKAARFDSTDILEKQVTLDARSGEKPLQILAGSDGGHIEVAAAEGAQIVLVPDAARRSRRDQYRVAVSRENGKAILRGIPPGSYKLFAWEQLEPNGYLNSDYLRAYEDFGLPVKISSGENAPVSVRLIPKD